MKRATMIFVLLLFIMSAAMQINQAYASELEGINPEPESIASELGGINPEPESIASELEGINLESESIAPVSEGVEPGSESVEREESDGEFIGADYAPLRSMCASEVLRKVGKTKNGEKTFVDAKKRADEGRMILEYDGVTFDFAGGKLQEIEVLKRGYIGVRGLRVGMSDKRALALFAIDNRRINNALSGDSNSIALMLYDEFEGEEGEINLYISTNGYGKIIRRDYMSEGEYLIEYFEDETGSELSIQIKNDKVESYCMSVVKSQS